MLDWLSAKLGDGGRKGREVLAGMREQMPLGRGKASEDCLSYERQVRAALFPVQEDCSHMGTLSCKKLKFSAYLNFSDAF